MICNLFYFYLKKIKMKFKSDLYKVIMEEVSGVQRLRYLQAVPSRIMDQAYARRRDFWNDWQYIGWVDAAFDEKTRKQLEKLPYGVTSEQQERFKQIQKEISGLNLYGDDLAFLWIEFDWFNTKPDGWWNSTENI
jgi:hypothetical protein